MPQIILPHPQKILVIRHGAFGDIVKSLGAFQVIAENHKQDRITLLTMPLFEDFCRKTEFFDDIMLDERKRSFAHYLKITNRIHEKNFDLVYDLQGSKRTGRYFKILNFRRKIQWSGNVKGCSFYQKMSQKKVLHPYERLAEQLRIAGLDLKGKTDLQPDLSWLKTGLSLTLPRKFALMIPGSSSHTLEKRWPALFYADLATRLKDRGFETVIIGGPDETPIAQAIKQRSPLVVDVTGKTKLYDILGIAHRAKVIIGNDTGPTFLACASGKPTFVPWSNYCKADLNAPRGDNVSLFEEPILSNLNPDRLWHAMEKVL
ncbi:MAG: glycosyltransferase family 9 protein [Alphaproteobacteria bacterium]|nr:glycosyltransferase family 9 protein [Alphaproteobacteria bacterium]NCQ66218.1 glycosyltransferase family 9 protein [Alphaproteobacteria bacterium]NCT06566.1 glycosyltransferase family 9 protein [Alphaproteobacteria bacterium]